MIQEHDDMVNVFVDVPNGEYAASTSSGEVCVRVPTYNGHAEFTIGWSVEAEQIVVSMPFLAPHDNESMLHEFVLPDGHVAVNGVIYLGTPDEEPDVDSTTKRAILQRLDVVHKAARTKGDQGAFDVWNEVVAILEEEGK